MRTLPLKRSKAVDAALKDLLLPVQDMLRTCIQCGTCTGSCPNAFAMDHTPRRMWQMVLSGKYEDLFSSRTFALCSSCYYCMLRCPRGLPLTEAVHALKQVAAQANITPYARSAAFYRSFIKSLRRHGRVREMEFMAMYFLSLKNPLVPLQYAPLGMTLMGKRKIALQIPAKGAGVLDALFQRVSELEAPQ